MRAGFGVLFDPAQTPCASDRRTLTNDTPSLSFVATAAAKLTNLNLVLRIC
jgi:hypothetical protein